MSTVVEGWKRVTTALHPFADDQPARKLRSAADVDSAIDKIENQFEQLEVILDNYVI